METIVTIVQVLMALQQSGANIKVVLENLGVDTREGICHYTSWGTLCWTKGRNTDPYTKVDIKGRLNAAQKFEGIVEWGVARNYYTEGYEVNAKQHIVSAVIQLNVFKTRGKRGGWAIGIHNIFPILSKNGKIKFCCKWDNYWASESMLTAGLIATRKKGKLQGSSFINKVIDHNAPIDAQKIIDLVNMVKAESGEEALVMDWQKERSAQEYAEYYE